MISKHGFPFSSYYKFYHMRSISKDGPEIWAATAVGALIFFFLFAIDIYISNNAEMFGKPFSFVVSNSDVAVFFYACLCFLISCLYYLCGKRWVGYVENYEKLSSNMKGLLDALSFGLFAIIFIAIFIQV